MTTIIFYASVKLYATTPSTWLCIFSQPLLGTDYHKIHVTKQQRQPIPLKIATKEPRTSMPLQCFVYTEQLQGQQQRYITRSGFATVSIADAEAGTVQQLVDIQGQPVGTIQLELLASQDTKEAAEVPADFRVMDDSDAPIQRWFVDSTPLKSIQRDIERKLIATGNSRWAERSNISRKLPHLVFTTVTQHCGIIPMWAFTMLNLRTDAGPHAAYFEQALYNAKYLLMVPSIDFSNRELVAEILNEIQTLPVRASLYVLDQSGSRFVDDWVNPLLSPIQNLVGLDCEDAVQRMLQEGYWLGQLAQRTENKELARLADIEKNQYISFLAAMTLKMPDGSWVYHAAGLKLDRAFVLHMLGIKKLPSGDRSWWPAVLLEGTAYTTGCWTYTSVLGRENADRIAQESAIQFNGGVDSICKVTPSIMADKNLYGAIQSLFSVELAESFGIVQIELGENNSRAANAKSIMTYDESVEWVKMELDKETMKKQIAILKRDAYPAVPIPQAASKPNRPPIVQRRGATVDFCVRTDDWIDDLQKELSGKKKIRATHLDLAADLSIVHVTDA